MPRIRYPLFAFLLPVVPFVVGGQGAFATPKETSSDRPVADERTSGNRESSEQKNVGTGGGATDATEQTPRQPDNDETSDTGSVEASNNDENKNDEGNDGPAGLAPFELLGTEVPPGRTRQLSWVASESFSGVTVPTPVLVAHGAQAGPVLCLTAAVHGDELNGIEMVRRVLYGMEAEELSGTVVGVPIVNFFGFRRSTRYLPDRRDLNRYFPGDSDGSSASRIAHNFFQSIVRHCDALVDLHTGSFHRTNLLQLRADLDNPEVVELSRGFGAIAVLQSEGPEGTLRRAATNAGIPAVTVEAGEPMRFQPKVVAEGVKGIQSLLNHMDMVDKDRSWGEPQPVYYESDWLRADSGGILFNRVEVGESVSQGQVLGTVTDPVTNTRTRITSPQDGRILGMALNQAVIPGFAVYRLGFERSREQISQQAQTDEDTGGGADDGAAGAKSQTSQSQDSVQQKSEPAPESPSKQRPD